MIAESEAPEHVSELVLYPNAPGPATPAPITLRLRSQHKPIRGVVVDAEHSPDAASVTVYSGTSPDGNGYVIKGGTARAFGISDCSAIYVTFGSAGSAGYVRVTAYSFAVVGFGMNTGVATLTQLSDRLAELINVAKQILAKL